MAHGGEGRKGICGLEVLEVRSTDPTCIILSLSFGEEEDINVIQR